MAFLSGAGTPAQTGRFSIPGTSMGYDMHRIPIVGNMFPNPADEFKKAQMQKAAQAYSMYRPEMAQAQMNAMNSQSASLQPMNDALAAMYGRGATQGFQAQNPFGPTAFTRGAAAGTNPMMPTPPGQPQPGPGEVMMGGKGAGSPNVFGKTFGDFERQAGLSEDWRLGRQSQSSQDHQRQVENTGGQYGAGGRLDPNRRF